MRNTILLLVVLLGSGATASNYFRELSDSNFQPNNASQWAWVSYQSPSVAVLPGSFNRTIFEAPLDTKASDESIRNA